MMSTFPFLAEVDNWARVGRGKVLQFFATDEEVRQWLLTSLPRDYAPYQLVGSDLVKQPNGRYIEIPFSFELSEFPKCMRRSSDERFDFWIHSQVLTPDLVLRPGTEINGACSCNGLVELQHGLSTANRTGVPGQAYRNRSRIALVDRIRNLRTGEVRSNTSYSVIYKALLSVIKKALVYSTLHTFPDGQIEEDTRLQLMTEAAAQAYRDGFPFSDAPGRRLKDS